MDNQRKDYRHCMLPQVSLPVAVTHGGRARPSFGVALNLSVSGIAIQFDQLGPTLAEADECVVRVVFPDGPVELKLPSVVIHVETNGSIPVYGLHFLPALDFAEQEYREKVIWRFLLEEQRRRRRVLNHRA